MHIKISRVEKISAEDTKKYPAAEPIAKINRHTLRLPVLSDQVPQIGAAMIPISGWVASAIPSWVPLRPRFSWKYKL